MDAEIITYDTKKLNNSKKSILSKKIFGYKDRTKNSRYVYERQGVLDKIQHIKITKKTFIVKFDNSELIKKIIKELGADIKSWKIDINQEQFKKRCG